MKAKDVKATDLVTFLKEWYRGKGYKFSAGYGNYTDTLEVTLYDPSTDMYHQYTSTYEQVQAALIKGLGSLLSDVTEGLDASLEAAYSCKFICSVTQKACRCDENGCRQRKVARFT